MRRRGASQVEIEATLLQQNAQRCVPPLDDDEVRKIAASVASYPEGGPDLLDTAWKAVSEKQHASNYEKFVALAQELPR